MPLDLGWQHALQPRGRHWIFLLLSPDSDLPPSSLESRERERAFAIFSIFVRSVRCINKCRGAITATFARAYVSDFNPHVSLSQTPLPWMVFHEFHFTRGAKHKTYQVGQNVHVLPQLQFPIILSLKYAKY